MLKKEIDILGAIFAGALLAAMIFINSALGHATSAVAAAWVAHGVGLASCFIVLAFLGRSRPSGSPKPPLWAYLGGVAGAATVWLAAISVNSALGLSKSLLLMVSGQVVFGVVADKFGFLGLAKKNLSWIDGAVLILIGVGCFLIMGGGQ